MTEVFFAHLTDIHISDKEESWGTMAGSAAYLLGTCIDELNATGNLDFVLITGDVLDNASQAELETFLAALARLQKPWHFIPGNHDGFYDPKLPNALPPHAAVPLIDPRMASPRPDAQRACWSRMVKPGVQLIGLDSRYPDDWAGQIDADQMVWLRKELEAASDKLIVLAVHHPLHRLDPKDADGIFRKFICENGEEVEALLDAHPAVRMVLAGHHHAHQISHRPQRLHVNTAALTGYPCVYRTIRLRQADGSCHAQIKTHTIATPAMLEQSRRLAIDSFITHEYNPDDSLGWVTFIAGKPSDQYFDGTIGEQV